MPARVPRQTQSVWSGRINPGTRLETQGRPETQGSWPGPPGHTTGLTNPNKELARFFVFCFSLPTSPFCSGGACYISRGGKKNAGPEAKVTRTAETSRSAAATAGSQVNTRVLCGFAFSRKEKEPALPILRTGLEAIISLEDPVTEMSLDAAPVPRPPAPPWGPARGSEVCPKHVLCVSYLLPARAIGTFISR